MAFASRTWFASVVTLVALVAAGCAGGTDFSSQQEVSEAERINPAPAGPDSVMCRGWVFPLNALDDLVPLESRPEIDAVVRSFLDSEEGAFWAQEGWQVVTVSDTEALVVVLQTEAQIREELESNERLGVSFDAGFGDGVDDTIQMSLQSAELVDGTWEWDGSSSGEDCELETPVPKGLNRVEWELNPDAPAPGPESTSIDLLATERDCVSGEAMGDRFRDPVVLETDTAVLISMTATPPSGDSVTCPGNPSRPVTIELATPLGDRELRDGSMTAGRISEYVGEIFGITAADR